MSGPPAPAVSFRASNHPFIFRETISIHCRPFITSTSPQSWPLLRCPGWRCANRDSLSSDALPRPPPKPPRPPPRAQPQRRRPPKAPHPRPRKASRRSQVQRVQRSARLLPQFPTPSQGLEAEPAPRSTGYKVRSTTHISTSFSADLECTRHGATRRILWQSRRRAWKDYLHWPEHAAAVSALQPASDMHSY